MTTQELRMMMLDIDGILTHHQATPTDVLTAAQALAVSAIGDLVNKAASSAASVRRGLPASSAAALHRAGGVTVKVRAIVQQKFTDLLHANGGGKVERTGIETKAYVERTNGSGEATGGDDNGNGGDDNQGGGNLEG